VAMRQTEQLLACTEWIFTATTPISPWYGFSHTVGQEVYQSW